MGISKGSDWGEETEIGEDAFRCSSDREASKLIETLLDGGGSYRDAPQLVLSGGDMFTTLGGGNAAKPIGFQVDLIEVTAQGAPPLIALSHVILRRRFWSGRFMVAMNSSNLGDWDLAPKGHPNDGKIDITEGELAFSERLQARTRARSGTHIPHPFLKTSRAANFDWKSDETIPLRVDGELICETAEINLRVVDDAVTVVIAGPK